MTRLGDCLHFGQPLKAAGNNYFTQIAHIVRQFCKGVKIIHFSTEIFLGNFYSHLGFSGHTGSVFGMKCV